MTETYLTDEAGFQDRRGVSMKVRRITWTGFILGLLALLMIGRFDPIVSLSLGMLGVTVSVIALLTAKD